MTFDVAVIGLGAAGSAALYHLARRNIRAVGIDRFAPGHDRGSSHGATRIIRLGYFEHSSYVPLLRRTYALWRELEDERGGSLMTITGILEIGRPDCALVRGTLAASRLHALPHSVLDAGDIMRRYPAYRLPEDVVGVLQPDGGYLEAQDAILAHLDLALDRGAEIRPHRRVLAIEPQGEGVRVITDAGAIAAGRAIVAAGPWTGALLPELAGRLTVTRQAVLWVAPDEPDMFQPSRFPVFMIETARGIHYGFPRHGADGVKIARHHHAGEVVDPDTYSRQVTAEDRRIVREGLADYLPAVNAKPIGAQTCLYTMSPDGDFIIDVAPDAPQVVIASPCSGHGFKFAPVVGEILADLATAGATRHDISRFRLSRFA
jgi:sarcosine oxidase